MAAFNAVARAKSIYGGLIAVAIAAVVGALVNFLQVKFQYLWTGMERYHGSMGRGRRAIQRVFGAIGQVVSGFVSGVVIFSSIWIGITTVFNNVVTSCSNGAWW